MLQQMSSPPIESQ
jgi:hypothetical protein